MFTNLQEFEITLKMGYEVVLYCMYSCKYLHMLFIYVYQSHILCEKGCCHIMNYLVFKKSKYLDIYDPVKYSYFILGFLITVGL